MIMKFIAAVELSANASVVEFTGIPQSFRDLELVADGLRGTSAQSLRVSFNGDTTSSYGSKILQARGTSNFSSVRSTALTHFSSGLIPSSDDFFGTLRLHILGYSTTDRVKTILEDSGAITNTTDSYKRVSTGYYTKADAITTLTIDFASADLVAEGAFYLYGVEA